MLDILAQLVSPPVQPGPVRLPGNASPLPLPAGQPEAKPKPQPGAKETPLKIPAPGVESPQIKGFNPYGSQELKQILAPCLSETDGRDRLAICATALRSRLFADGYINSKVLIGPEPSPGELEVVAGRIESISVVSDSSRLQRRLQRLLQPLRGKVLHLPSLTAELNRLQKLPGIGLLKSNLNRIGEDSSRASLLVNAEPAPIPVRGELSVRNDGNSGSGQFRGLATVVKSNSLAEGDVLLLYSEINNDSQLEIGSLNGSLSYGFPLTDRLQVTTAFGASRRQLVEVIQPLHDLSFRQLQLYNQIDYSLYESSGQRWLAFAGFSLNRNDSFLRGQSVAAVVGGGDQGWLKTGFLRLGIGYDAGTDRLLLNANIYGLQGIGALSNRTQRDEMEFLGINPDQARALGSQFSFNWLASNRWQLNLRGAGQIALNPLTSPMGFSLGSDSGLRGLPGQVISGDSGLLGSVELSWLLWRNHHNALQLVPFIGEGKIWTEVPGATLSDSIGAGGMLLRWHQGRHLEVELGWVSQFQGGEDPIWQHWILGNGIYSKAVYRF